jgi:hypothetical protein
LLQPALTVLPLLRAPIGRNLVLPHDVALRALSLIFFPSAIAWLWVAFTATPLPESVGLRFMWYFAGLYLISSLIVFARRWWGQNHREHIHQSEAGWSFLAWYTPVSAKYSERLAPACLAGLGSLIAHTVSQALGWWLLICAGSLLVLSGYENRRYWAGERDTVDAMTDALADEERVKRYESAHGSSQSKSGDKDDPDFADLN